MLREPMVVAALGFLILVVLLVGLLLFRRIIVGRFYLWRFQKGKLWGRLLNRMVARMDDPRPAELEELTFAGRITRELLQEVLLARMDLLVGRSRLPLIKVFRETGLQNLSLIELKSRDVWARRRAADSLGRAGGREVARQLIVSLTDPDEDVRGIAARSLGRLGVQVAAPHMVTLFQSLEEDFCLVIANALVDLGPSTLLPLTRGLVNDSEKTRYFSALAISRICEEGRCRHEVMKALPMRRATDVKAVYPTRLNDRLRRLTRDESPRVRRAAVEAQASTMDVGATERLEQILADDPVPEVRAAAAKALGDMEAVESAERLLMALNDHSWQVAYEASRALAAMGAPELERLEQPGLRETRAPEWRDEIRELAQEASLQQGSLMGSEA